jgi:hypothetical protein
MIRAALLFPLAFASYAQIAAPQLGLIPDGAMLRPVAGIPASAIVGSPITFTRNLSQTVTAPSQGFALAVDADSGEVLLVTVDGLATPIPNVASKPDRVQLSPQGSSAVLWYSAARHAQILSGLPANPSLRDVDLSFAASEPAALSVSDDGATLAASLSGTVYEFAPTGPAAFPAANPVLALAFSPGSSDLVLVSAVDATRMNAAGTSLLASFPNSLNPVAAALDARRLVIAGASGAILTLDLASSSLASVDCGCAPAGLFPMSRSVYRLTGLDGGAFKLFEAEQNAVWFAPLALPPAASTSGDQQ